MFTINNTSKYLDIFYEQFHHVCYIIKDTFDSSTIKKIDLQLELPKTFLWPPTKKWFATIFPALSKKTNVIYNNNVPQIYNDIVMIKALYKNKEALIAFDFSDYPDKINNNALSDSILYFKMQYLKNGYSDPKIIPGQYIPGDMELYWFLAKLRSEMPKKQYNYDVYGRFGSAFAVEIRSKATSLLKNQKKFDYIGDIKIIRYSRYLKEISHSKICIDLPGNGPFCFRLIEYLALGKCIIGPPHATVFDPPLVDGVHIRYCKPDLSDLIDLCEYYLKNETERNRLASEAKNYFDSYLHNEKIADYYINKIITIFKNN